MEVDTALLPCPLCKIPHFENVHSLRATLINVATTQLVCPVCNESVMGLDKLTIHLFSHVSINIDKTENLLTEGIKEKETLNRENVDLIGANDYQKNDFQQINERSDVINCDICDFTFTDHTILDLHQKLLHQTNPDKETGNYNFHCHLCSKKFKMRGSLIVHLRVAHFGFAKSNSEKKSNSDTSKEANKNGDSKQWECDICCKMFTTKYFLKKHKRLHTGRSAPHEIQQMTPVSEEEVYLFL